MHEGRLSDNLCPKKNGRPVVAVNYYFNADELGNRIFDPSCNSGKSLFLKVFRSHMERRGFRVVTLDTVDFNDPDVKYVLYFEYNWRLLFKDPFLKKIPFEKRALVLLEPANVNPTMYLLDIIRRKFGLVFTWDLNLLARNPGYTQINVPVGAEPKAYAENRFSEYSFSNKRFLVSVSTNRWSYMPQSTFRLRRKAYRYFENRFPTKFDLFGGGWNQPCIFYERWFGFPFFKSWRGIIQGASNEKVSEIAKYRFSLCFENNASEPGYISEKIIDCFCARSVPVYLGPKGGEKLIPREAWINLRDFKNFSELAVFLEEMGEDQYARYVEAIDRFMKSEAVGFFSTEHFNDAIASRIENAVCGEARSGAKMR